MRIAPSPALASCVLALLLTGGCARAGRTGSLPSAALLADSQRPALFLGPEAGAAQIGYLSDDVVLTLAGPVVQGRVLVRVEGALRTQGYVAADQLSLRVQRRGRVRGTPVYVAPGDRVRVLGAAADRDDRLQVEVTPRLGKRALGRYEGSYPRAGLGVAAPPRDAPGAERGVTYRVPAQLAVTLHELPATAGQPPAAPLAELPAQPEPYEVSVVRAVGPWLAVRAGSGPYLIGWTQAALQPLPASAAPLVVPAMQEPPSLPSRLANEPGELRRIAAGSQLRFGEQVIGVFGAPGFARVQRVFEGGFVDVFAAADEGVALRGVVRAADLSEISTTAAARSPAP